MRGINIYSHHTQSGDSWPSDWGSQRRWRNARFWFHWRPTRHTRVQTDIKHLIITMMNNLQLTVPLKRRPWPTLSWEFSMTFRLLSEDVTSGPNSTHPAEQMLWWDDTYKTICNQSVVIQPGGLMSWSCEYEHYLFYYWFQVIVYVLHITPIRGSINC